MRRRITLPPLPPETRPGIRATLRPAEDTLREQPVLTTHDDRLMAEIKGTRWRLERMREAQAGGYRRCVFQFGTAQEQWDVAHAIPMLEAQLVRMTEEIFQI